MKITIGFSKPKKIFPIGSWLIRLFEWTKYSHVYMSFYSESLGLSLVYQASGTMVNFISATHFNEHNTTVKKYELDVPDELRKSMIKFCVERAGIPYSLKQLIGIAFARVCRLLNIKAKNPFSDGRAAYVCSEAVGELLLQFCSIETKEDLDFVGPKQIDLLLAKR